MENQNTIIKECIAIIKNIADDLEFYACGEYEEIRASNLQYVRQKLEQFVTEREKQNGTLYSNQ
jgi:hypothetical protein